ncbi:MAG: siderophore-interacting protein [Ferrovibrionaceae bacterium]
MGGEPGLITRKLLQLLMRPARVAGIETPSPRFRIVELQGEALRDVGWMPGQKVQIAIGSGLTSRTYTPMSWDEAAGSTRLLAFLHGDGPGSRWAAGLRAGDGCHLFGPRRSLDLTAPGAPLVLFGDETSFGLAASLRRDATLLFEAGDTGEAHAILAGIGIGHAMVLGRTVGDAHLLTMEAEIARHAATGAHFALTGKASSIQRLIRCLRSAGVGSSRISSKAYWAPGKTGLD